MSSPVIVLVNRDGTSAAGALDSAGLNQMVYNLNDVSTAEITVPTMDAVGSQIELMKSEFQIWINGTIKFWGYFETVSGDTTLLTYECCDLLGYFKYRFISNTSMLFDSPTDQVSIMEAVAAQMQANTYQDLGIEGAGVANSGITRLAEYMLSDHQNSLDIFKTFPAFNDGCDFSVEPVDPFGVPGRFFTPWYPQKGSFKPNFALEWGKNILTFNQYAEDGTKLATIDYATGSTDSSGDKIENHYEDTAASEYYGQFQAITTDGSELDPDWLLSLATQTVTNRNKPVVNPTLVCIGVDGTDLIDDLQVGDVVPVYVDAGRIQLNTNYRITQATYKADTTYSLLLGRVGAPFIYPPGSPVL